MEKSRSTTAERISQPASEFGQRRTGNHAPRSVSVRSKCTIQQTVAQTVRDFEQLQTHQEREWVAVFLNEETVVIAVHGSLTAAESALAGKPARYTQVSKSRRQLFADTVLLQEIERICGMSVVDTTVELEPATGGVVLLFTTDTAGKDFLLTPGRPVRLSEGGSRRTKSTGYVIRVWDAPGVNIATNDIAVLYA